MEENTRPPIPADEEGEKEYENNEIGSLLAGYEDSDQENETFEVALSNLEGVLFEDPCQDTATQFDSMDETNQIRHPSDTYRIRQHHELSTNDQKEDKISSDESEACPEEQKKKRKLAERSLFKGDLPEDLKSVLKHTFTLSQDDLLERDWTEKVISGQQQISTSRQPIVTEQMWGTGTTAQYQITRVARTKHQISFLASEAKEREEEFIDQQILGRTVRNETRQKYGW